MSSDRTGDPPAPVLEPFELTANRASMETANRACLWAVPWRPRRRLSP